MDDEEDRFTQITLRIPKLLHKQLKVASVHRSRSMNAEIIRRLEISFQSVEDRLAALEAEVFHPKLSLEEVRGSLEEMERDLNRGIEDLQKEMGFLSRSMR